MMVESCVSVCLGWHVRFLRVFEKKAMQGLANLGDTLCIKIKISGSPGCINQIGACRPCH